MAETIFSFVRTFKGGIHPPENKDVTKDIPMVDYMDPQNELVYPMSQHIGAPCKPIVAIGDYVMRDQMIGEPGGFVSAPVYSAVSGTVKDIRNCTLPNGNTSLAVAIENDHQYTTMEGPYKPLQLSEVKTEDIMERIAYAGIVGMGGAGFPTKVKLSPNKPIDYIIINGSECEPYLTSDYRVMVEDTKRVIEGAYLVGRLFPNANIRICVEDNKPKAIKLLNQYKEEHYYDEPRLEVVQLLTKYPQGGEKMLISAATGREVPSGGLPADVGCIVLNIDTTVAIYRAVVQARPLQRRIVTVSGSMVERPGNYRVRIGTSMRELVEFCGLKDEPAKMISGGPMMGAVMTSLDVPVTKTSSSILLLSEEEAKLPDSTSCIRCGRCVDACPIHLRPYYLAELVDLGKYEEFEKEFGCECIECGSCSYVCPAKRHLTQSMKYGRKLGLAARKARQAAKKEEKK